MLNPFPFLMKSAFACHFEMFLSNVGVFVFESIVVENYRVRERRTAEVDFSPASRKRELSIRGKLSDRCVYEFGFPLPSRWVLDHSLSVPKG